MTPDDEVRAMEIATKLVETRLSWAATSCINTIGAAIVDLWQQCDPVEEIRAVGDLLKSLTDRDRVAIARGERWGKRSRILSQDEARRVLRGLTLDQLDVLADRSGHSLHELFEWSCGQREIHSGALWLLGQQDEMAKITGETR
jgi:hypothetical protein